MCGIFGYIGEIKENKNIPLVCDTLLHRGPDSCGDYCEPGIYLCHTRLSIQDLSEQGNQPMISEDGNFVIVFNGEIYNHWNIREDLINDFNFRSSSDTETLLYAYIKYGISFLEKLNGIFAFAIFDRQKGEVILARDQFGVKPLYLYKDDKKLLFSSELKSFLDFGICKTLSPKGIANYLTFSWSPGGYTPFKNVLKFEPGCYSKISISKPNSYTTERFYQMPFCGKYSAKTKKELVEELDVKLVNAVSRQLISDVPIGFFLSGGLDSSLLVAIAKKLNPDKRIECFTIDTGELSSKEGFKNDLDYAKKVASYLGVNLNIIKADINIMADFDKMIWHLDEPQTDAAPLNVLNICKAAREKGIKVLIGGTAGDDLFSGYRRHQVIKVESLIEKVPIKMRSWIIPIIKKFPIQIPLIRRIRRITENLEKPLYQRLSGYFSWISYDSLTSLFEKNFLEELNGFRPTDYFLNLNNRIPNEKSVLNQVLFWEMNTFLVDHNLNYTDKLAMACGVEVRVPYLDLELVDFSTTIPPWLKLNGHETKYILKKVAEKYLPKEVIYRPKTGFGAPMRKWILEDLDSLIQIRLSTKRLKELGIFKSDEVWKLINDNKKGKVDASFTIWAILALESWIRQFVENKTKQ